MASSKATPINQLNNQFNNQNNDTLVNDILKEIDQTNVNNSDVGAKQAEYQMDPSVQPQVQFQEPDQNEIMQQQMMQQQMMQQQQNSQQVSPDMQQYQEQVMDPNMMFSGPGDMSINQSLTDRILDEVKNPLLVAVIFFAVNFKFLDQSLIKFVPKALSVNGDLTIIGQSIKALLAGVAFFLLKKFI